MVAQFDLKEMWSRVIKMKYLNEVEYWENEMQHNALTMKCVQQLQDRESQKSCTQNFVRKIHTPSL
jgi:hypothetical protein